MLALILNPIVLAFLVWIVGRSVAEFDFGRMFFIALGVSLAGLFLVTQFDRVQAILMLIPLAALLVYLLMRYCYLTLNQSIIVAVLYFTYQILFDLMLNAAVR